MKKVYILLICLLVTTNLVYALDCQYTEIEPYTEIISQFYIPNSKQVIGPELKMDEFGKTGDGKDYFKLHNTLPMDITVKVEYTQILTGGGGKYEKYGNTRIVNISRNDFAKLETQYAFIDSFWNYQTRIENESITYEILNPDLVLKKDNIPNNRIICKQCINKTCLNDGVACQLNSECGGAYCIEGYCSNSEICYNDDCKCQPNEIQCDDNKKCTPRNSVALDTKTVCEKNVECVSGYIDPTTKLCAKSPSQIQQETDERNRNMQIERDKRNINIIIGVIILAVIIALGIGIIIYFRYKHEKEIQKTEYAKQKTLQMQMELIVKKLHGKNDELEQIRQEIEEIKVHKKIKETELNRLNKLKKDKDALLNEIKSIEQTIDRKWENLKPFPDEQAKGRLVIINPYLGGYKCFYNKELELKEYPTASLVHIWVWKKHNDRDPRRGYHIHHMDEDKYNNDPRNLEELEGEEHYEKHRK